MNTNQDPQDAQNDTLDTLRNRLIWQYHHENMMEEWRREQIKNLETRWDSWEYRELDTKAEAHFRKGQALMAMWFEINELQAETNRRYWYARQAANAAADKEAGK